jgi:hypothetical protein
MFFSTSFVTLLLAGLSFAAPATAPAPATATPAVQVSNSTKLTGNATSIMSLKGGNNAAPNKTMVPGRLYRLRRF